VRPTLGGATCAGAAALLVLTACGGSSRSTSAVLETRTPHERAVDDAQLAFARCMRTQGIDFPDPERRADGSYFHEPPPEGQQAAYNRATDRCGVHFDRVNLVPMTAEERRELEEAIERDRQASGCMRRKGYDWPDPIPDQGAWYDDDLEAAGIDPDDPVVMRELAECEAEARE
jgi:hypothetical protein